MRKIAPTRTPRKRLTLKVNSLIARTQNLAQALQVYQDKVLQRQKPVQRAPEVQVQVSSVRPTLKTAVSVIHQAAQLAVYAEANKE